ncbi:nuclear transport factor 2 family protein [Micromonosporaceae bacterium Da 78-11]
MQPTLTVTRAATLLTRYLLSLDDDELDDDWASALFTEDARVVFPMSRHDGIDGLAEYHRVALSAFDRTQHLHSPTVVDQVGTGQARLRANVVSTHVHRGAKLADPLFVTGTLVTGEARDTEAGWRLRELDFRVIWMTGSPPLESKAS